MNLNSLKSKKFLTVKRHHEESKKAGHGVEGTFNSATALAFYLHAQVIKQIPAKK